MRMTKRDVDKAWKRVADLVPKLEANRIERIRLLADARQATTQAMVIEKKYREDSNEEGK